MLIKDHDVHVWNRAADRQTVTFRDYPGSEVLLCDVVAGLTGPISVYDGNRWEMSHPAFDQLFWHLFAGHDNRFEVEQGPRLPVDLEPIQETLYEQRSEFNQVDTLSVQNRNKHLE